MLRLFSILILVINGLFAPSSAPAKNSERPFTIDDLVALERLSDLVISPSGRFIAYVKTTPKQNPQFTTQNIWLVDLNNQALTPRQVTFGEARDYHPVWSNDNKHIYYLSDRSKTTHNTQVWRINVYDGVTENITNINFDIETFHLSPAENYLALTTTVHPECQTIECSTAKDRELDRSWSSAKVYDKLFVRHWDRWNNGKIFRLFTLAMSDRNKLIDISSSLNAHVPPSPGGDNKEIAFSQDGKTIYFSARLANREQAWSTNYDIYSAPSDGSTKPYNLTKTNLAWDAKPAVSPDGRYLAYLSSQKPGYESDKFNLVLRHLESQEEQVITSDWDRSIDYFKFTLDGQFIIASAQHIGQKPIFKINIKTKNISRLVGKGSVSEFVVSKKNIVYGIENFLTPKNYYSISIKGGAPKQITAVNKKALSDISMSRFEQFDFSGWNQEKVYGYLMKPFGFEAKKRYPLVLLIHGGPQGSFSNRFHPRWNAQLFAAQGYGVVMIDFHGSTGYGQAFTDAIQGDWGGKPLVDLQKGLDFVLAQHKWMDAQKICALGASYGGYMVNWIAGKWASPFKCLVNHAGVFDNRMMYYATDELWFVEWEHGGSYFANPDGHERHNPVNFVDKWRTPMLVIQGGLDFRIPETQSIATFSALQRRNIESRFLYFPDENHHIRKAKNRIKWYQEVNDWLAKHLK